MNLSRLIDLWQRLDQEYDGALSLRERIQQARDYVDSRTHRADLVQALPPTAPPGYLLVTPSDPLALYVGRGNNLPLLRIPGSPL